MDKHQADLIFTQERVRCPADYRYRMNCLWEAEDEWFNVFDVAELRRRRRLLRNAGTYAGYSNVGVFPDRQ